MDSRLKEMTAVLKKYKLTHGLTPEKFRLILQELGPTYIKLGQIMSLHSDILPKEYCEELMKLCSDVEPMPFEQVEYWPELCRIMEWSRTHVHSTFHICWGAQAALYYHYGINKTDLPEKLFGVYPHRVERRSSMLMRGFDDVFMVPHSRHTSVRREDIERCGKLKILASSEQAGVYAMATEGGRQIFITGHSEYDARTLESEYLRDKNAGLPIHVPENYYPDDDDTKPPMVTWRSHANLLYQNWLNYFVYQTTPYDLSAIRPV